MAAETVCESMVFTVLSLAMQHQKGQVLIIPLKPPNEVLSEADTFPLWAAMFYPEDDRDYLACLAMYDSQQATAGPDDGISKIFDREMRRVRRRSNQGYLAGCVVRYLVALHEHRPPASLLKAYYLTSQHALRLEPTNARQDRLPTHERDIRKAFQSFKNSAHIWEALHAFGRATHRRIVERDKEAFVNWARLSAAFEAKLSETDCMGEWQPKRVPISYHIALDQFRFPDLFEDEVELLKRRPKRMGE